MKILIGVDDSPYSRAALDHVKRMRWPAGTRALVLAATRPQVVAHELVDAGAVSWLRTAEKESIEEAEELTSRMERELQQAGLETEARVVRGDPRTVLVDAAIEMGADLLVVGSHGRSGLDRLLMGSVASHVVAHAPCTVTVVRAKK